MSLRHTSVLFLSFLLLARAVAAPLGILVPAYFFPEPNGLWDDLNRAAARVPLVAIMNPNSGPGQGTIAEYTRAVSALRTAGGRVIGYVSTAYTSNSLDQVTTEIDRYFAWYDLDGIFLDEMTNTPLTNYLAYYEALFAHVQERKPGAFVVANPGTVIDEAYLRRRTAHALVTFEHHTGYANYVPDTWTRRYAASNFVHLPYAMARAADMTNAINLAVSRNVGWIYVTDDSGDNPWDKLPTYWDAEVNFIAALNRTALTIRRSADAGSPMRVDVSGVPGRYVVEATSNFANWTPLQTNLATNGLFTFFPPNQASAPRRFFRMRRD